MKSDKQRIEYLLTHPEWTAEDEEWMSHQLLHNSALYKEVLERLYAEDATNATRISEEISRRVKDKIRMRISLDAPGEETPVVAIERSKRNFKWIAAAVLIVSASIAYWLLNNAGKEVAQPTLVTQKKAPQNDVEPGGNKAVLTLSTGKTIVLDSAAEGVFASEDDINITKKDDGEIVYSSLEKDNDKSVGSNTVTTPRGGQYKLVLTDGTNVWLNAASSITYPVAFTGTERNVVITGEAYFEVAKSTHPFKVKVNNMTVEVLGTHFNINSYTDELNIKTTLLEGSVKVLQGNGQRILKQGEQSQVTARGEIKVIKDADLEATMAWKNGMFYFSNADVQTVMKQLTRWYDVDVIYEGAIPVREFQGEIQKNLRLSQVLNILGKMEVNFRIEGRKLIVMP